MFRPGEDDFRCWDTFESLPDKSDRLTLLLHALYSALHFAIDTSNNPNSRRCPSNENGTGVLACELFMAHKPIALGAKAEGITGIILPSR